MRLAIISTPRSGNSWLRNLLAAALAAKENAVHTAQEFDWDNISASHILQIHWTPSKELRAQLRIKNFHIITIARHPIDVLISILHFCKWEPQTALWLSGEGGNEDHIIDASPTSDRFLDYCLSDRAQALLNVTTQWWQREECSRIKYEDLATDPLKVLSQIRNELNIDMPRLQQVTDDFAFDRLKTKSANNHVWQGRPGIWKKLIKAGDAAQIHTRHSEVFKTLGYRVETPEALSYDMLQQNWNLVNIPKAK